jgi:hypothetical protein
MWKIIKISIIFLLFYSCASYYKYIIKKEEILNKNLLPGRIAFAGTLLEDPVATWRSGNYIYYIPFNEPKIPTFMFFSVLNDNYRKKIELKLMDKNKINSFTDEVASAGIKTYSYMTGFIPLFDSKTGIKEESTNETYPLDEDCLAFLNEHYNADYYIVCVGKLASYQIPDSFNGFNFQLTPEFSIVIYSKDGKKVFSKSYQTYFDKITENHMLVRTYYDYLNKTIFLHKEEINSDLGFLNNFSETTNLSIQDFISSLVK